MEGSLALAPAPDPDTLARSVEQRPELRGLEAAVREADADLSVAKTFSRPNYAVGMRYQREGGRHIVFGGVHVRASCVLERPGAGCHRHGAGRTPARRAGRGPRPCPHRRLQTALAAYDRRAAAARVLETEALPGLDDTDALTTRSYDVGQLGLPDVLVIRRELLDTRFQHLSALFEAALARVQVDAAAGVLR